jgi:UPF0755 protein
MQANSQLRFLMKKYWPALAGVAFVFTLAFSIHLVRSNLSEIPDFPTREIATNEKGVIIHVDESASGLDIANELFNNKVTASVTAFYQLAINDKRAMQISPGEYEISLQISASQALEQLLDNRRIRGLISIIEGDWQSEIFQKMRSVGFTDIGEAVKRVEVPAGFSIGEGILFPAQYSFAKGTKTDEALQKMVERFTTEATRVGLLASENPFENLIIASLVQAEGDPEDFTKVARVIKNRLKIGMPLQLDATVQYALKKRGSIWVTTAATKIKSPYNTYQNYGLPPGPIGSPGVAAMQAALNPAEGDWLYFITVKPKDTRFTKSHDEFLKWKIEYQKNVKAGLFN